MISAELKNGALLKHGEYRIERLLGQGGFGITYEAEQLSLGRRVAVKEFFMKDICNRDGATSHVSVPSVGSKELVEKFRAKFIREARMIAALDHEHIVKIHDVYEENGTAYYVMEFLGGGSLDRKIKDKGAMPESEALGYIRQIADALSYLHSQNILHFDVKPSNVLLGKNGSAKLIDFGISKHYDEAGVQTSSTPVGISKGYAPLEQYQQGSDIKSFTPATDIYSLGATLYALLTGNNPPEASVIYEDGLPIIDGVSPKVMHAIEKAMRPRRKERPQKIEEFLSVFDTTVPTSEVTILQNDSQDVNDNKQMNSCYEMKKQRFPFLKLLIDIVAFELFQIAVFCLIPFIRENIYFAVPFISCFYTVVGCVLRQKYEFWSPKFKKHLLIWYIIYFVIFGSIIGYILITDNYLDTMFVIILFAPIILLLAMALFEIYKKRRIVLKRKPVSEVIEEPHVSSSCSSEPGMNKFMKKFWSSTGKAGIILGGVSAFYMVCTMGAEGFGIVKVLLWVTKFVLCIWLMNRFMKKWYNSNEGLRRAELFKYGTIVALLSAIVYSSFYLFIDPIDPEDIMTAVETMKDMQQMDSDFLQSITPKLSRLSVLFNLGYCWLFGTILSSIFSTTIVNSKRFDKE